MLAAYREILGEIEQAARARSRPTCIRPSCSSRPRRIARKGQAMTAPAVAAADRSAGAARFAAGKLSPVALTEACLDRIERVDGQAATASSTSRRSALEAARAAEREIKQGNWRGPLHGIPIGVKDNYLTRDMPTTAGSVARRVCRSRCATRAAAARLRAAGAVLIGKTRTHEFAWGNVTPPVRNPWDLTRVPSGSSGGSGAAVAAGLCMAASGLGHRRIDPHAGGRVRHGRTEGDLRPCEPRRCDPAQLVAGSRRAARRGRWPTPPT